MADKKTAEKEPEPEKAPTQEDVDKAVYDATHNPDGTPKPIAPGSIVG